MIEKINTVLKFIGGSLLSVCWFLGWPVTFAYLILQDNNTYHSVFSWLLLIVGDAMIATIWPLYWLIFHWL